MDGNVGSEEITIGFPGAADEPLTRAERLERRGELTLTELERALTRIIAYLSDLEADVTLFRHDFPAERLDAASVRISGEQPETSPDFRSFSVLLTGREITHGAVANGVLAALGKLPLRWVTAASNGLGQFVTAAELKILRPARFGSATANGRRVTTFEAELGARILTSPPRGVTRSGADPAELP